MEAEAGRQWEAGAEELGMKEQKAGAGETEAIPSRMTSF